MIHSLSTLALLFSTPAVLPAAMLAGAPASPLPQAAPPKSAAKDPATGKPVVRPRAAPVFGKLDRSSGLPILRLRGSRRAMGRVHGRVLAKEILASFWADFVMTAEGNIPGAERMRRQLRRVIRIPASALAELQGIYEGMKEAYGGELPELKKLGRRFELDDLVIFNARDALRAFGCSGFTVWGSAAGEAGVITTRNFDFPIPGQQALAAQLVLVRHETGKVPVATVTFPGYIGAFTGVSAQGVCAFMHDGTGRMARRPQGVYVPLPLKLYEVLAASAPEQAKAGARKALESVVPYPFSYMVRLITPRVKGGGAPSQVLRVDHSGEVTENRTGKERSITTNHYLTADRKPVAAAGRWTQYRYGEIEKVLNGGVVNGERAWAALAKCTATGDFPTLHSLTVYPEKRRLDLSLAQWRNGVVPATRVPRQTMAFADLFGVAQGKAEAKPAAAGK